MNLIKLFISFAAFLSSFQLSLFAWSNFVFRDQASIEKFLPLLLGVWLVLDLVYLRFSRKQRKKIYWRLLFAVLLTAAEFIAISNVSGVASRWLLGILLVLNLCAAYLLHRAEYFLEQQPDLVNRFASSLLSKFDWLSAKVHRLYGELIAGWLVGLVWADYILKMGLTLSSDGITYLSTALVNTSVGLRLTTTDPPLYPLILWATDFLTEFPADRGAILSVVFLLAFFSLFAAVLRIAGGNSLINVLFILILGTQIDFIELFLNPWTEPLYLVLLSVFVFLLFKHRERQTVVYLVMAGIVALLALFTRYLAATCLVVLGVYLFAYAAGPKEILKRIQQYFLPVLAALVTVVFLLWLNPHIRRAFLLKLVGALGGRSLISYVIGSTSIPEVTVQFAVSFWEVTGSILLIVSIVLIAFVGYVESKRTDQSRRDAFRLSLFLLGWFVVVTLVVFSITNHLPRVRYWIPLFPIFCLAASQSVSVFFSFLASDRKMLPAMRAIIFVSLLALFVFHLAGQALGVENVLVDRVRDARVTPRHQSSPGFDLSPTAKGLSTFFEEISANRETNILIVLEADFNAARGGYESEPLIAQAFMFRSSILSAPNLTRFQFTATRHRIQRLTFYRDETPRAFEVIIPNGFNTAEVIAAEQERLVDGSYGMYLIISQEWLTHMSESVLGTGLDGFELVETIDPYLIYEVPPP